MKGASIIRISQHTYMIISCEWGSVCFARHSEALHHAQLASHNLAWYDTNVKENRNVVINENPIPSTVRHPLMVHVAWYDTNVKENRNVIINENPNVLAQCPIPWWYPYLRDVISHMIPQAAWWNITGAYSPTLSLPGSAVTTLTADVLFNCWRCKQRVLLTQKP